MVVVLLWKLRAKWLLVIASIAFILNAAALLMTAGIADELKDGADIARDALLSGRAGAVLDAYVEASRG